MKSGSSASSQTGSQSVDDWAISSCHHESRLSSQWIYKDHSLLMTEPSHRATTSHDCRPSESTNHFTAVTQTHHLTNNVHNSLSALRQRERSCARYCALQLLDDYCAIYFYLLTYLLDSIQHANLISTQRTSTVNLSVLATEITYSLLLRYVIPPFLKDSSDHIL